MSELQNNNEKKTTEKCYCQKKIMVLDKEIKALKDKVQKQLREIETIKKALKR